MQRTPLLLIVVPCFFDLTALPTDANLSNFYLFPNCAGYCYHFENGEWQLLDDHSLTEVEQTTIREALDSSMKETGFDKPPEQVWGERIDFRGASFAFSSLGQEAPVEVKETWDPLAPTIRTGIL
jgi:hypothetical protein